MRVKANEYLQLTTLDDKNTRVLDVRVWRKTPTGGVPTNKSITVEKKFIVPLIMGLQRIHRQESSLDAGNHKKVAL